MEKKLYSKPLLTAERFTPQEFTAACEVFIPAGKISNVFWADMVHDNGFSYSLGKDGYIDSANMEQFHDGSAPTALMTTSYGVDARGRWFEHMTLYRKLVTSHNAGSDRYTNTRIMSPMSGYEDVAIYIGPVGVGAYIYRGEGGAAPSNPDWLNPSSTFKTMS
ncbi:MAG: hypothetical protein IJK15_00370 [Bacteroidaceae bacterium]|nr:hypothetical protein [Bacteroidaceae bacterium]